MCRGLQEHSCSPSHADLDPGAVQPLPHNTRPPPVSPQGLGWLPTKPTVVALHIAATLPLLKHHTKILEHLQSKPALVQVNFHHPRRGRNRFNLDLYSVT